MAPKLTRRSARKGANLDRVRREAQAFADLNKVRVFVLRMACGAHYMTTHPPPSPTTDVIIDTVERRQKNKRVQQITRKRKP